MRRNMQRRGTIARIRVRLVAPQDDRSSQAVDASPDRESARYAANLACRVNQAPAPGGVRCNGSRTLIRAIARNAGASQLNCPRSL